MIALLCGIRPQDSFNDLSKERLDGYLFEFTDECALGTREIGEKTRTLFFMKDDNIKWESLTQYSCIYDLPMIEINRVAGYYNSKNAARDIDRVAKGLYFSFDSTKYYTSDSGRLTEKRFPGSGVDEANVSRFGCDPFVCVYRASFFAEYLEHYEYMTCRGDLKKIPEYGWIGEPSSSIKYLYSVCLPAFTELPIRNLKKE